MKASMRTALACVLLLICVTTSSALQQPTRQSLEANKKKLADIQTTLTSNKKKIADLEAQAQSLAKEIENQEKTVQELEGLVAYEEDEVAFLESPARAVIDVQASKTFVIDFNGTPRFVMLHGVSIIDPSKDSSITKAFKKQFLKKKVYLRCADELCNRVYLYLDKSGTSLNAAMVQNGLASVTEDAKYDLIAYLPKTSQPQTSSPSGSTYSSSPSSTAGKDVQVRGYYRKDGTYVRPHTRSAPGSKKKN